MNMKTVMYEVGNKTVEKRPADGVEFIEVREEFDDVSFRLVKREKFQNGDEKKPLKVDPIPQPEPEPSVGVRSQEINEYFRTGVASDRLANKMELRSPAKVAKFVSFEIDVVKDGFKWFKLSYDKKEAFREFYMRSAGDLRSSLQHIGVKTAKGYMFIKRRVMIMGDAAFDGDFMDELEALNDSLCFEIETRANNIAKTGSHKAAATMTMFLLKCKKPDTYDHDKPGIQLNVNYKSSLADFSEKNMRQAEKVRKPHPLELKDD